jgi:hypothetical protein
VDVIKKVGGKLNAIIDLLLLKVVDVIKRMFGGKKGGGKGSAPSKGGGKKKPGGKKKSYKPKGGGKKGPKKPKKPKKPKDKKKGAGKALWVGDQEGFVNEAGEKHTLKMFGTWDKPLLKMASAKYIHIGDRIQTELDDPSTSTEDKGHLHKAQTKVNAMNKLIAAEKKKARGKNYSANSGNAFDKVIENKLVDIGNELEKTSIGTLKTLPPSKVAWGMNGKRAGWVKAEPLSKISGNTQGSGPSGLRIEGWDYLEQIPDYDSNWVRAHLLNDNLHGPGTKWNLTPATRHVNLDMMEPQVENIAKEETKKGRVLSYHTQITYGYSGGPTKFPEWKDAFNDFPSKIEMKVNYMRLKDGKWEIAPGKALRNKSWTIPQPPNLDGYPLDLSKTKGPGQINSYTSLPYLMCLKVFEYSRPTSGNDIDGLLDDLEIHYNLSSTPKAQREGFKNSWKGKLQNLLRSRQLIMS